MKNRITKYFDERPELIEERIEQVRQNITDAIEKNSLGILKNFKNSFNDVFVKGAKMQKDREKGAIAYVCIEILRSSLLTRTYQLRIDLYDKNLHLDQRECASQWGVDFAFQWLDEDMNYFTKRAREKLIRILDAEMIIFMQHYQEHYFKILEEFCERHIQNILQLPSWEGLKKEETVKFTYGEFLDKGVYLEIVNSNLAEGSKKKDEW